MPHFIKELMIQNELTRLLYVTDIGFYPKAKGHYRIRNKGSEQNILIYCTEGKGWISTNGTRHEIVKGHFSSLRPDYRTYTPPRKAIRGASIGCTLLEKKAPLPSYI